MADVNVNGTELYELITKLEQLRAREHQLQAEDEHLRYRAHEHALQMEREAERMRQLTREQEIRVRQERETIRRESGTTVAEIRKRLGVLDPGLEPDPVDAAASIDDFFKSFGDLFGDFFGKHASG